MKSYRGKLLWVDLTTKTVKEKQISEAWMREFIGGEGFVIKLLYDRLPAKIDPLSPENLLIFASGPLNGSMAPSSGRMAVGFKSPLSGTCSSASVGGHFVPAMKKTGYDVVVVQGTGGVALFALQFAKLLGAYAIVLSSSDEKLAKAQALGADEVLNYVKEPAWGRTVKAMAQRLSGRDGADHVVELGGTSTLEQSLRAVRAGGTLSLIGVLGGAKLDAPLGLVVTRAVRLQGVTVGSRDDFLAMCSAMARVQMRPVVDSVYPFEALKDALAHLKSGRHFGKVCIQLA